MPTLIFFRSLSITEHFSIFSMVLEEARESMEYYDLSVRCTTMEAKRSMIGRMS